MTPILQYLVIGLIFVIIDSVWLVAIANKFYKQQLGDLLKPKPNLVPAAIFYLLYVFGIQVFALSPALQEASLVTALWRGGLLGLLMYATYDLTNQSTIKKWPLKITLTDLAWGTFVTALTAALAFLLFD
jgi:uncharacterized membrane protein